jgi:hypothetical protein
VGLDVTGSRHSAQVGEQLLFVPRRQQRRQQDDVGRSTREGCQGGIARLDQHEVGPHLFAYDPGENLRLA